MGCGFGSAQSANFLGQLHTNDVMGLATAFDQAQHASRNQATHRLASGFLTETNMAGQPGHRKAEPELAFEAAMAEKMRVDGAVDHGKVQPGRQQVFHLFPHLYSIEFFVVHRLSPGKRS